MRARSEAIGKRAYVGTYYDRDDVVLVRADERRTLERVRGEASCFVAGGSMTRELHRMLRQDPTVAALSRESSGDWWRVVWRTPQWCAERCVQLHEKEILTYEGGVSALRRLSADRRFAIARPRRCYLDLETDSRVPFSRKEEMRILVWCVVDGETGSAITGVLKEESDRAERELLNALAETLLTYDQVCAWNGDRFDFVVLKARLKRVGCGADIRRLLLLDHMEVFKRMNTMAAESGEEKTSYALQAISMAVLGEGKDDFDASKTWDTWLAGGDALERMVRYCAKDVQLMVKLEAKTGYIELLQTLCEVCGVFPDSKGLNPGSQVETFLLRLGMERGVHFPTRFVKQAEAPFRGAFVMDPTDRGVLRNVHVADFASLYPSIILTWNISPDTLFERPEPTRAGIPVSSCPTYYSHYPVVHPVRAEGVCEAAITETWFDTRKEGLLPLAVDELVRMRREWTERKSKAAVGTPEWKAADRKSTAYKIAANSFYGVISSPQSRLYNRLAGEAVTQCGVWLIQQTMHEAERRGFRVVYGDTDSLFVAGCTREEFGRFVDWCNDELYGRLTTEKGCATNRVKLAYEKAFDRIVFVTAKRYIGRFAHYKGVEAAPDAKPEVKGLEYKRGDSTRLARALQQRIAEMLMAGEELPATFEPVLDAAMRRVLDDPLELADVVISKSLSRSLSEYATRTKKDGTAARGQPYLEIAKVLKARGDDVGEGTKIRFVCVDGASKPKRYIPASDWTGECDRYELWEELVFKPSERLLAAAFPAHDWSRWAAIRPRQPRPTRKRKAAPAGQTSLRAETPILASGGGEDAAQT